MPTVLNKISSLILAALILLSSFSFFNLVLAATATDAYDQPSSLKTSTASNHSFSIVSPSGVAEGETIIITFPSDFDTSTIVEDDIDLADDGIDLTTAANCSGSEEASAVMALDVLTLTICAGDGGAIAAASTITVEIGTNAAASGSGSNQITNPSNLGTYFVDVAGSFGDTASIPIPIVLDDDSGFSAVVPSNSGGGGGGPTLPTSSVDLTAPIGGEVMQAGDSFSIVWSSSGSVAAVNLYFSADNGFTFTSIASNLPAAGSYSWTVPDVSTTQALIRADGTDLAIVAASDTSNAFSILGTTTTQSVTVVSPNGGENFEAGTTTNISWTSSSGVLKVDLYYSLDLGATFNLIASNQNNGGSYSWAVPDVSSNSALIRIDGRDGTGVVATDLSDAAFSIYKVEVLPAISLIQPNGGETLTADSIFNIEWTSVGAVESVNVYYSLDNGLNYTSIATGQTGSGSFAWTVPNVDSTNALVRVDALISNAVVAADISETTFIIESSPEPVAVTVVSPNGGEDWAALSNQIVTWSSRGGIDIVNLYYSPDNGLNYYLLAQKVANSGSYLWSVPDLDSKTMLLRVDGYINNVIVASDTSDRNFTVSPQQIIEPEPEPPEEDQTEEPVGAERSLEFDLIVANSLVLGSSNSSYKVLAGTEGRALVKVGGIDLAGVRLTFGETSFALENLAIGEYSTVIPFGNSPTLLTVSADFESGDTLVKTFNIIPVSYGQLSEIVAGQSVPVSGAVVIVFVGGEQWNAISFSQSNPIITDSSGSLGWYVPNGSYRVTFGKNGYEDGEVSVRVNDNILRPSTVFKKIIIIDEGEGEETGTVAAIEETIRNSLNKILETFENVRSLPEVQTAATVAEPIVVATTISGAVILISSFNFLPFLQYLLTAPILFFARRRRQQFGLVYNAFTKVPVDLAIVRLFSESGKLVKTMVTDQEGRYFFQIDPGFYRIEVIKSNFVFPSETMKGQKTDGQLLDIYTGGLIEVTQKQAIIAANIPLEPVQAPEKFTAKKLRQRRFLRVLQRMIGFMGAVLAILVWLIQPTIWTFSIMVVQLLILLVTMILIKPRRKKGWGIVYDKNSRKSLHNTVVRLYEPKYNKLLETAITDGQGRYAFLAGPNDYYVTYEKPGFEKAVVSPVDYKDKKEPTLISVDVGMQNSK